MYLVLSQFVFDTRRVAQALLPVMMTEHFRSLHAPTLKRQWFGLVCIGLFMVRACLKIYPVW